MIKTIPELDSSTIEALDEIIHQVVPSPQPQQNAAERTPDRSPEYQTPIRNPSSLPSHSPSAPTPRSLRQNRSGAYPPLVASTVYSTPAHLRTPSSAASASLQRQLNGALQQLSESKEEKTELQHKIAQMSTELDEMRQKVYDLTMLQSGGIPLTADLPMKSSFSSLSSPSSSPLSSSISSALSSISSPLVSHTYDQPSLASSEHQRETSRLKERLMHLTQLLSEEEEKRRVAEAELRSAQERIAESEEKAKLVKVMEVENGHLREEVKRMEEMLKEDGVWEKVEDEEDDEEGEKEGEDNIKEGKGDEEKSAKNENNEIEHHHIQTELQKAKSKKADLYPINTIGKQSNWRRVSSSSSSSSASSANIALKAALHAAKQVELLKNQLAKEEARRKEAEEKAEAEALDGMRWKQRMESLEKESERLMKENAALAALIAEKDEERAALMGINEGLKEREAEREKEVEAMKKEMKEVRGEFESVVMMRKEREERKARRRGRGRGRGRGKNGSDGEEGEMEIDAEDSKLDEKQMNENENEDKNAPNNDDASEDNSLDKSEDEDGDGDDSEDEDDNIDPSFPEAACERIRVLLRIQRGLRAMAQHAAATRDADVSALTAQLEEERKAAEEERGRAKEEAERIQAELEKAQAEADVLRMRQALSVKALFTPSHLRMGRQRVNGGEAGMSLGNSFERGGWGNRMDDEVSLMDEKEMEEEEKRKKKAEEEEKQRQQQKLMAVTTQAFRQQLEERDILMKSFDQSIGLLNEENTRIRKCFYALGREILASSFKQGQLHSQAEQHPFSSASDFFLTSHSSLSEAIPTPPSSPEFSLIHHLNTSFLSQTLQNDAQNQPLHMSNPPRPAPSIPAFSFKQTHVSART
eukprot:MONOS_10955.1-p1 / transcript=MONOS_10955.1 / gene=MONOS_10955 / organism=Monocercomonoides_exilis_PA203 / gene_product=unspecified product / transcript_product=unspecified product / location=Mono_scaffold00521:33931-36549(-) / protein_length=873 / sequence_SO=supercontig / SO=protein_coding / is_pseudo=false